MANGPVLLTALLVSIVFIILGTAKLKMHPFIVLLLAAFGVGFMAGMPTADITQTITSGFGQILAYIGIVIVLGTIIGTILEKSGAAIRLADLTVKVVGKKYPVLAMGIIGYIVSIPVFCDSAFVILSSLKRSLIRKTGKSAVAMTIALATGLYATHTFVPPTPGPVAAAGNLGIDKQLGLVILFGLLVSAVAMFGGYLWSLFVGKHYQTEEDLELKMELSDAEIKKLPSSFLSVLPIVLPILLIAVRSVVLLLAENSEHVFILIVDFIGNPVNALLLGVFCSFPLLDGFDAKKLSGWIGEGIQSSASILVITGAGGAFGAMLKATHIGDYLGEVLSVYEMGLLLPFIIAAALKTAQGSSTVSLVATSALVLPLLPGLGLDSDVGKALTVMAIGSGAMTISHANDSFFWVVTQFSKMDVKTGYRTHTLATLIQGIVSFIFVYLLGIVFL